jgi:hypothetical protein
LTPAASPPVVRVTTPGTAAAWATFAGPDAAERARAYIRERWGSGGKWDGAAAPDLFAEGGAP